MGLALSVGYLAELKGLQEADEAVPRFRRQLDRLNAFLRKKRLPEHAEPEEPPAVRYRGHVISFPYSYVHHLRRAVAYALNAPAEFATINRSADPTADRYVDLESTCYFECHLICHSDCEGYYVPVDFPEPLFSDKEDKIPGCMVGSSQRLLGELVQAAPLLEITLDANDRLADEEAERLKDEKGHRYGLERLVWFSFFETAQASVDHRSLIVFH